MVAFKCVGVGYLNQKISFTFNLEKNYERKNFFIALKFNDNLQDIWIFKFLSTDF